MPLYSRSIFSCLCTLKEFTDFYSSGGRLPAVILALSCTREGQPCGLSLQFLVSVLSHLFLHQRTILLWPLPSSSGSTEEKTCQAAGRIRKYALQQLAYLQEISMNGSLVETYRCHCVIHYKLSQESSAREKPPFIGNEEVFTCPMRCARSMACRSLIGFQSCSTNTTVSAPVKLSPSPPT